MQPITQNTIGDTMENHLTSLPRYCASLCVIECCGLDACDFSSIHIASYCQSRNPRFPSRVAAQIKDQAETLMANYGSKGGSARGITLEEINERMSGQRVDTFVTMLLRQVISAQGILANDNMDDRDPILVWGKA